MSFAKIDYMQGMVHVNIYSAIININAVTPVSIIKYMSIYTALGELNNLGNLNCGFEVQTVNRTTVLQLQI